MTLHLEYLLEKGYIDISTLTLTEKNNSEGIKIAKAIGVKFIGWWDELDSWLFMDNDVTETTFAAKNVEEAKNKLEKLRISFEKAKTTPQPK
jgi:hypothetical protein